jgi:hypothetical protein
MLENEICSRIFEFSQYKFEPTRLNSPTTTRFLPLPILHLLSSFHFYRRVISIPQTPQPKRYQPILKNTTNTNLIPSQNPSIVFHILQFSLKPDLINQLMSQQGQVASSGVKDKANLFQNLINQQQSTTAFPPPSTNTPISPSNTKGFQPNRQIRSVDSTGRHMQLQSPPIQIQILTSTESPEPFSTPCEPVPDITNDPIEFEYRLSPPTGEPGRVEGDKNQGELEKQRIFIQHRQQQLDSDQSKLSNDILRFEEEVKEFERKRAHFQECQQQTPNTIPAPILASTSSPLSFESYDDFHKRLLVALGLGLTREQSFQVFEMSDDDFSPFTKPVISDPKWHGLGKLQTEMKAVGRDEVEKLLRGDDCHQQQPQSDEPEQQSSQNRQNQSNQPSQLNPDSPIPTPNTTSLLVHSPPTISITETSIIDQPMITEASAIDKAMVTVRNQCRKNMNGYAHSLNTQLSVSFIIEGIAFVKHIGDKNLGGDRANNISNDQNGQQSSSQPSTPSPPPILTPTQITTDLYRYNDQLINIMYGCFDVNRDGFSLVTPREGEQDEALVPLFPLLEQPKDNGREQPQNYHNHPQTISNHQIGHHQINQQLPSCFSSSSSSPTAQIYYDIPPLESNPIWWFSNKSINRGEWVQFTGPGCKLYPTSSAANTDGINLPNRDDYSGNAGQEGGGARKRD